MRDGYHKQFDRLMTELADLCHLVGDAIRAANRALQQPDVAVAERVIHDDVLVDRARDSSERHAYALLAPAADDLRAVLAAIRTAEDLERMGDLAVHVAEAVRRRHPRAVVPEVLLPRFTEMGRIAGDLAEATERVIRTQDLTLAGELTALDDEMEDLHRTLFTVIGYEDWSYGVSTAIDLSLLSRCYERFAEHAVSVARQTAFAITGALPAIS